MSDAPSTPPKKLKAVEDGVLKVPEGDVLKAEPEGRSVLKA